MFRRDVVGEAAKNEKRDRPETASQTRNISMVGEDGALQIPRIRMTLSLRNFRKTATAFTRSYGEVGVNLAISIELYAPCVDKTRHAQRGVERQSVTSKTDESWRTLVVPHRACTPTVPTTVFQ